MCTTSLHMDNPVFVFGSFSEGEASHFQFISPSFRNEESGGRAVAGDRSSELIRNQDTANVLNNTPSAPVDASNGILKGEESIDVAIGLSIFSLTDKSHSVTCNGGTNVLADKHYAGNGFMTVKEMQMRGLADESNGNLSSKVYMVHNDNLHSESNSRTPSVGASHGRASFNDEISVTPAKGGSKTWTSLLDFESRRNPPGEDSSRDESMKSNDSQAMQVTELSGHLWLRSLKEANIDGKRLQPRGLINKGNLCFLNATLQALISCSPFVHLLQTVQAHGVPETEEGRKVATMKDKVLLRGQVFYLRSSSVPTNKQGAEWVCKASGGCLQRNYKDLSKIKQPR